MQAAFDTIPDMLFLLNEKGIINYYNDKHQQNLYSPSTDILNKSIYDLLPEEVSNKYKTHIAKVISLKNVAHFEYGLMQPHGKAYFEARITYLPEYQQVMAIIRDITEQHNSAEIIRYHAYYDTLTALPNRFLALDRLSQLLIEGQRNNEKIAVLFIDLDDFKKVNDTLGHDIGDQLLVQSANRLNKVVRQEDTVGRLGGDEFIVLLRGVCDNRNVLTVVEDLLKAFRDPFQLDGRELILTLSLGIAIYPDNGTTSSELLRNADIAMYQAKAFGRNTYSFFTKVMNTRMLRRLEIEEQMHGALDRNEIDVLYQPKIQTNSHRIVGAEVLVRWHNPKLGHISPEELIPIAEHTGLIVSIGRFVIQKAIFFLKEWQEAQQGAYTMAINLSPRQFRDETLLPFIENALQQIKIAPQCLEFEITEGVLIKDQTYVSNTLNGLNKLGAKLSMDDFGTGYSSLSYLRRYPFKVLKIDHSFVCNIISKKTDFDLVKASIAMAHSLGLKVVAEGVETKAQVNKLNKLHCDYIQGNYYSKPITARELLNYAENFKKTKTAK